MKLKDVLSFNRDIVDDKQHNQQFLNVESHGEK
jgi:hypothetical protein